MKSLRWIALLAVLVGCTVADAAEMKPGKINVIVVIQGDSALVIGAWAQGTIGTFPLLHYHTQIQDNAPDSLADPILARDSTPDALQFVDTLRLALPVFGDTLKVLTFEVQAADTAHNVSIFGNSAAFSLSRPFTPPGIPDSVRVDTTLIIAAVDRIDLLPADQTLTEGFGSLVMSAAFMSGTDVVACSTRLLVEVADSVALITGGICDRVVARADTLVFPNGVRETPAQALAGIIWDKQFTPTPPTAPPPPPPPAGSAAAGRRAES